MNYVQIAILALIQGLAELLPVSSSAHFVVAEKLMGRDPSSPEATLLLVMAHTGTMIAVLFYFWPRWRRLLWSDKEAGADRFHFLKMVVVATICTGILGLGLKILIENVVMEKMLGHSKGEVENLFKNLPLIATGLFVVGLFILVSGSRETKAESPRVDSQSAVWIGLVQGLCLPFRGFSRSGATISTALFRGIARPLAEDFSFALAVVLTPPVILLEVHRLWKARESLQGMALADLLLPQVVCMVFSFIAGLVALRILSAVLERGQWKYFGYYCIAASLAVFAAAYHGF
jgi:undecaprenyl-diphosphatase